MVTSETPPAPGGPERERADSRLRATLAAAAAALCAGAVGVSVAGAPEGERLISVVVFGLLVGAPMAVGLAAWRVHHDDRLARLLVVAGALFSLTVLSQASVPVLYSIGRVAVWLVVPVLLYLMLAFPSGRLTARRDRRLMIAVAVLALSDLALIRGFGLVLAVTVLLALASSRLVVWAFLEEVAPSVPQENMSRAPARPLVEVAG